MASGALAPLGTIDIEAGSGSALTIVGRSNPTDTIGNEGTISPGGVNLNGQVVNFSGLDSLEVDEGVESDFLRVTEALPYALTVIGSPSSPTTNGNDTLELDGPAASYASAGKPITFTGGGSANPLIVNGGNGNDAATYSASGSGNQLSIDGLNLPIASNISPVLNMLGGTDTYNVLAVLPPQSGLSGSGYETINVNAPGDITHQIGPNLGISVTGAGAREILNVLGGTISTSVFPEDSSVVVTGGKFITHADVNIGSLSVGASAGVAAVNIGAPDDAPNGVVTIGLLTVGSGGTVTFAAGSDGDICSITSAAITGGDLAVFNGGTYTIGDLTMTAGTATFRGSADYSIATVSVSGGTLRFSGSGGYAVGSASISGGSQRHTDNGGMPYYGGQLIAQGNAAITLSSLTASDGGSFTLSNDGFSNIYSLTCNGWVPCMIGGSSIYSIGGINVSGLDAELDLDTGSLTLQNVDSTVENGGILRLTGSECDLKGSLIVDEESSLILDEAVLTLTGTLTIESDSSATLEADATPSSLTAGGGVVTQGGSSLNALGGALLDLASLATDTDSYLSFTPDCWIGIKCATVSSPLSINLRIAGTFSPGGDDQTAFAVYDPNDPTGQDAPEDQFQLCDADGNVSPLEFGTVDSNGGFTFYFVAPSSSEKTGHVDIYYQNDSISDPGVYVGSIILST